MAVKRLEDRIPLAYPWKTLVSKHLLNMCRILEVQ